MWLGPDITIDKETSIAKIFSSQKLREIMAHLNTRHSFMPLCAYKPSCRVLEDHPFTNEAPGLG